MTEIQQVVDELRFLLQRESFEQSEELSHLLGKYSELCHQINARLRRCDECVKQGLRSEALHLAEAAPNLLDAIAVLDFPERQQLLDAIGMYFLTPPEPLLLDVASALNEAYAEHEPLQKLLDTHRLLALARSPLAQRLSVLRSLAQLDEASPHWDTDIREMERARFREFDVESRAAAKHSDTATLKSLLGEAQSEGWREAVPAALLRDLKARSNQTSKLNALRRLEELNEELHTAFSAMDAAAARALRDEWNRKQQVAHVSQNDPLFEHVAPVFDWLEELDRADAAEKAYQHNVAAIERALESDHVTYADFKRLGDSLDRQERSLPPSLDSRFKNRLATLELTETRRKRLVIGAGVAAFLAVVGFFGIVVHFSYQGEQARRIEAAVETFIGDGLIEEARKLFEQQPARPGSDRWMVMQKKLVDAERAEHDRTLRLRSEIETATASTDSIRVETALRQARELARTTEEKIAVGELQSTWQKRANAEMAEREQVFRQGLTSAAKALHDLDTLIHESRDEPLDRLQVVLKDAENHMTQLRLTQGNVSNELRSQATLLDSRLIASRKAIEGVGKAAELLNRLTAAALLAPENIKTISDADNYAAVLREFATQMPNDPRSSAFASAADKSPLRAVVARQIMMNRWRRLVPADEKETEARLQEVRSYLSDFPQSPDAELMTRLEKWLASVERRFTNDGDPDGGIARRFSALFSSKFIADGHTLRDNKGRTYYCAKPDPEFGDVLTFRYLVGFNGETRKINSDEEKKLKPSDFVSPMTESPPQAEIAKKVRSSSRSIGTDRWNSFFFEVTEILLESKKVDDFLRYLLIVKTLEFAGLGDPFLEDELEPILKQLNDDDLDRTVAWMDPNSPTAVKARALARELLKALPSIESIKSAFMQAAERQKLFESELFALRFSVGWLEKKGNGEWNCRSKWSPTSDYSLFAVSHADPNGARTWVDVGHVRGKSLAINSDAASTVGEAAVVFASSEKAAAKTAQLP